MITSMTGYARGEDHRGGYSAAVEVRSLNHRFLDIMLRLPKSLGNYEQQVKEIIRQKVGRGRLNVVITLKDANDSEPGLHADEELAHSYKMMLENLQSKLGLKGEITIDHLLHFTDILSVENGAALPEEAWLCVEQALLNALDELNAMRAREGQEMANDMRQRIDILQEKLARIEARSRQRGPEEFAKLQRRLRGMIDSHEIDASRLELELALLADRVDVTEECIRFRSHNTLFLEALANEDSAGRKLNFLLQEMNREANTIGAKACDAEIAHLVIELKEDVERLREQIQNIE
jgi:uncharacterized protein (TIGR00255 family)